MISLQKTTKTQLAIRPGGVLKALLSYIMFLSLNFSLRILATETFLINIINKMKWSRWNENWYTLTQRMQRESIHNNKTAYMALWRLFFAWFYCSPNVWGPALIAAQTARVVDPLFHNNALPDKRISRKLICTSIQRLESTWRVPRVKTKTQPKCSKTGK